MTDHIITITTAEHVTHPAALHEVGDHDDHLDALLPDESPESMERVRQRALCADVLVAHEETVDVVRVYVVTATLARQRSQRHQRVVVWNGRDDGEVGGAMCVWSL